MTIRRLPILLALALVASVAGLTLAAPASAAKPCWKVLLNDWFDGRIDKAYSVSCYRAAIKNLPEDVESYSNAREEINRALLAALNKSAKSGRTLTGSDLVPAQTGTTSTLPGGTNSSGEGEGEAVPGSPGDGGGDGPLGVLKPANADSVPIPLLVLAGLALVLLAAASAGFVARRVQARRAGGTGLPRGPETP